MYPVGYLEKNMFIFSWEIEISNYSIYFVIYSFYNYLFLTRIRPLKQKFREGVGALSTPS